MSKELTKDFAKLPIEKKDIIFGASYDYDLLNQQEKLLKERRDKQCRPVVETAADTWGITDEDGHIHLNFSGKFNPDDEESVDIEITRQKKVSRVLNTVAAEKLLREKGIYNTCTVKVVTFDEEKIIEAYEAGEITARELDNIFTENVTYATIVKANADEIRALETARKAIAKAAKKGEMVEIESN